MLQSGRSNSNDVVFTLSVETDPRARAQFESFKRMGAEASAAMRGGSASGGGGGGPLRNEFDAAKREVDQARERIRLRKQELELQQKSADFSAVTITRMRDMSTGVNKTLQGVEGLTRAFLAMGIASGGSLEVAVKGFAALEMVKGLHSGSRSVGAGLAGMLGGNAAAGAALGGTAAITAGALALVPAGIIHTLNGGFSESQDAYQKRLIAEGKMEDPSLAEFNERNRQAYGVWSGAMRSNAFQGNLSLGEMRYRNAVEMAGIGGDHNTALQANKDYERGLTLQAGGGMNSASDEADLQQKIIQALQQRKQIVQDIARAEEESATKSLRGAEQETREAERQLQLAIQKHEANLGEREYAQRRFGQLNAAERSAISPILEKVANKQQVSQAELSMVSGILPSFASQSYLRMGQEADKSNLFGRIFNTTISESGNAVKAAEDEYKKAAERVGKLTSELETLQQANSEKIKTAFESIGTQMESAAKALNAAMTERIIEAFKKQSLN